MTPQDYSLRNLDSQDGPIIFSRKYAPLDPHPESGESDYILTEEFVTSWVFKDVAYRIRVPNGFVTDIASIPRVAWEISGLTPDGFKRNAAVVHDFLYMCQGQLPIGSFQLSTTGANWIDAKGVEFYWTRDECDRLFLRIMKASGENAWTRGLMYWAVKLFGGIAWNQNDPNRHKWDVNL